MANTCRICRSDRRQQIDRDLIGPESLREISARYGLAKSSLHRHRTTCLRPKVAAAIARREDVSADRLVSTVNGMLEMALVGVLRSRKQDPPDEYGERAWLAE